MWIIGGILDDKSIEESLSNVTKSISLPKKSKVINAELWGKRKLSYPINNYEDGTYFWLKSNLTLMLFLKLNLYSKKMKTLFGI